MRIENFRSIRQLDLRFRPGKNVVVGRNNAGKSNIVRALDIVLGESSPTWARSENIGENDFFCAKNGADVVRSSRLTIACYLSREEGEDLNFDEIDTCVGLKLHATGQFPKTPKRIAADKFETDPRVLFDVEEEGAGYIWVDSKLQNQTSFRRVLKDQTQFAFVFYAEINDEAHVTKGMRFAFRETEASDWLLGFRPTVRNELLQSAIIPSFRDPSSQLRITSWSWYGKLLKHLVGKHERTADLEAAFGKAAAIADEIFDDVHEDLAGSTIKIAFPGTEVRLRFNPEQRQDIYKSTQIYVDDGFNSLLSDKGSGIQSATVIGLFTFFTQHVAAKTSALLCIEEPELYLHPHARRVLSGKLDDFIGDGTNQVLITTHSPEFINATDSLTIVLVRKDGAETSAAAVKASPIRQLLFDANQTELFFADKVVLCEGLDAPIVRAIANAKYPGLLDVQNVSVIGVGGKDRLAKLAKLIVKLGIACYVIADFDFFLRDATSDADKYKARKHRSIESLDLKFFAQPCIAGNGASKLVSRIAKVRASIKSGDKAAFYTAKRLADVDHDQVAGLLSTLRKIGVGILEGEIEDAFADPSLLDGGKVSVDTVYRLNSKLRVGDLQDYIKVEQFEPFFDHLFGF